MVSFIVALVIGIAGVSITAFMQHLNSRSDEVAEDDPNENGGSNVTSSMQYIIGYILFGLITLFALGAIVSTLLA